MSQAAGLAGSAHLELADGVVHLDPDGAMLEAMLEWTERAPGATLLDEGDGKRRSGSKLSHMGLDATVRCRCWEDGLTSAPPVARELITEDEGYLSLSVDYDGNEDLYERLHAWKHGACAHENMKQAGVRVASWIGYGLFVEALETLGWERFPTLNAYLEGTSATLPAASAPAALAELREFEGAPRAGKQVHLIDEDTGKPLFTVPPYGAWYMLDGSTQICVGVDEAGLFVRDDSVEPVREVFRSLRCTQEVIGGRPEGEGPLLRLTDAGTSEQADVALFHPVGGDDESRASGRYPRRLRVDSVPVSGADFHGIVERLTVVLLEAEATGNPVVWHP